MKDASHGNYDIVRVVGTQNRQFPIKQRMFPSLCEREGVGSQVGQGDLLMKGKLQGF